MKTDQLFKKYYKILNEQEPATETQVPEEPPGNITPPEATVPSEVGPIPLDENEKYVIKILTNSFIFNPSLFDKNKQKFIFNKINEIKQSVNIPISKIIEEIKSILSLDNSLKVESKTLSLLNSYIFLFEQPADATEPQTANQAGTSTPTTAPSTTSDVNKLNLAEIFPLYKELIMQSLLHVPTDEELIILKPIVNEFSEVDPEKIVTTIKDLLGQESDIDIESDLANA